MDRTDDIKKGIYQVLKIGSESKPKSRYIIKTALISNIHAIRHYDEYLADMQDIVWTKSPSTFKVSSDTTVGDLPLDLPIYNLFDGIISFTQVYSKDLWIDEQFAF